MRTNVLVAALVGGISIAACTGQQSRSGGLAPPVEEAPSAPAPLETWPEGLSRAQEAQLLAEREDRYLSCLREEGIRVERSDEPGGGWKLYQGGLADTTFEQINAKCRGPEPQIPPITREEYSALYDLNLQAKACLEARGLEISEPPSREKWIEDSLVAPEGPWSPYNDPAVATYVDECPEPDLYDVYGIDLYGSE